jgi:hypothetical protein
MNESESAINSKRDQAWYRRLVSALRLWHFRHEIRLKEEFERDFPDKCFLCSYYRYGYEHGLCPAPEAPPHAECKDANMEGISVDV